MFSSTTKSPIMVRLPIAIAEFAPDLNFVLGTNNVPADYLSRCFRDQEQMTKDPICTELLRMMEQKNEIKLNGKIYKKANGLIYITDEEKNNSRLVVPKIYGKT